MKMLALFLFIVATSFTGRFLLKGINEYNRGKESMQMYDNLPANVTMSSDTLQSQEYHKKQMKSGKIGIAMGLVGTVAFTWWGVKTWKKAYTGN